MQVDYHILVTYGGVAKKLSKGEFVFHEGALPCFLYQVLEGEIKLFSANDGGKELTQGVFREGQTFGEPPLLLGKPYPSTAQAITRSVIIKIGKDNFLHLLNDYPDLSRKLLHTFAERIYHKATSAQIWVSPTPEEKLFQFLKKIKVGKYAQVPFCVPYTRQQIADFTGLRVETVIRTLLRMNQQGKIKILNHKIYY